MEYQNRVEVEVDRWVSLQKRRGLDVILSKEAITFIGEVIENISHDRPDSWKSPSDPSSDQEYALSLISNALNEVVLRNRYHLHGRYAQIKLTSWDLWAHFPRILRKYCFIPKDDM